jgi:subfamily B ATP-binding cassette protein MsbA
MRFILKKLDYMKSHVLGRVESFQKSLLCELLMTSKRWTLMALGFGLLSSVLNMGTAVLFLPSLIRVLDPKQKLPIFDKIDSFFGKFLVIDQKYCFFFFSSIFFLMLLKTFFYILKEKFGFKLVQRHSLFLKKRLLIFFNQKELDYFVREGSSVVLTSLEIYLYGSMVICNLLITLVFSFFSLSLALLFLFKISWTLSLLVAVLAVPLFFVSRKMKILLKQAVARWGSGIRLMNQQHINLAAGIRYLKLGNQQERESFRILENSKEPLNAHSFFGSINFFNLQINETFGVVSVFLMGFLFYMNPWNTISASSAVFFSFLMVLARGIQSFSQFQNSSNSFHSSLMNLKKIEDILSDKREMEDDWGSLNLFSLKDHIQLQSVSFIYPGTHRQVLNSIEIQITKGQHLALVGPSGSGKSTLSDLILGFYRPTSGQIKINGKNYKDFKLKDYRKLFGLVSQEATMFFPTIRENLILFKPEATEFEIQKALDQADALEFVSKLPEGIDTIIGERGVKLSGGQKQRLSIARALLHNPEILIFDEATSSLDSLSEARIIESIKKASVGRTSVTIAHRLSTVMHCDKIIFLENGWIVEEGSPQELMQKQSRFRKYAELQNLKMSG